MAYNFGDGFDLYTALGDMVNGYWDAPAAGGFFTAGRFAGSQSIGFYGNNGIIKTSGVNDAVHHLVMAIYYPSAPSASTGVGHYFTLVDAATAQCTVAFCNDGAIRLQSGAAGGTTLATFAGAVPLQNTWYAFEIEVVINSITGAIRIRKNGNTSNDFDSGPVLNTRTTANNFANKLSIGLAGSAGFNIYVDDLYWRSDASAVAWMGDIRCQTRYPATDVAVQYTRSATTGLTTVGSYYTTFSLSNQSFYSAFVPTFSGTVATATFNVNNNFTGNVKAVMYDNTGPSGGPGTVIGTGSTTVNPVGPPPATNTITFSPPITVVKNQTYYLGLCPDVSMTWAITPGTPQGVNSYYSTSVPYASFPTTNPLGATANSNAIFSTFTITVSRNCDFVNEAHQDALTTYVYDSTPGHSDLYGIAPITSVPASVIAVTTRGYMQKSDAGSRTAAIQLKSGGTTVSTPTLVLSSSGWQWTWRTDTLDPNTSAAWTPSAVNNAQIGPLTVS